MLLFGSHNFWCYSRLISSASTFAENAAGIIFGCFPRFLWPLNVRCHPLSTNDRYLPRREISWNNRFGGPCIEIRWSVRTSKQIAGIPIILPIMRAFILRKRRKSWGERENAPLYFAKTKKINIPNANCLWFLNIWIKIWQILNIIVNLVNSNTNVDVLLFYLGTSVFLLGERARVIALQASQFILSAAHCSTIRKLFCRYF